jgi:flagellar biosynthetic protein FlhB
MAEDSFQDRTEQPTPKRRSEARREGRLARSRDLGTAVFLMAAVGFLAVWTPWAAGNCEKLLRSWLESLQPGRLNPADLTGLGGRCTLTLGVILSPVLLGLAAASLGANLIQGGWVFAPQRLAPDFSRLQPLNGFKRLFSGQSLAELGKALAKAAAIGGLAYVSLSRLLPHLPALLLQDPVHLAPFLKTQGMGLTWRILPVFLVLGGLDYLHQRHRFEKSLRMTKQEVKEEMRQVEGDPRIKARMRSLMRQMATKRMMADVPKADVVITNPTHVAVALQYDGASMAAPRVVAKGQGFVALKIMALAQEVGVPMVQNVTLARSLYKTVEVGEFIPTSLYRAVAEVLAYVYSLRAVAAGDR